MERAMGIEPIWSVGLQPFEPAIFGRQACELPQIERFANVAVQHREYGATGATKQGIGLGSRCTHFGVKCTLLGYTAQRNCECCAGEFRMQTATQVLNAVGGDVSSTSPV